MKGLVSVVVPTWNSAEFLERTMKSIKAQTYSPVEIIVVDRGSTDGTLEIAKRYADRVYVHGSERVEQKAFGLAQCQGEFYVNHSSDLLLPPGAIEEAIGLLNEGWDGVEIDWVPDESRGFWARVRKLEMLCYITDQRMFRPNVIRTELMRRTGGYNLGVKVAGDDYQIKIHLDRMGAKCTKAQAVMVHTGEPRHLREWVRKDVYYGRSLPALWSAEGNHGKLAFAPPLRTYWRNKEILFRSGPKMFFSFVLYRSVRYMSGAIGIALAMLEVKEHYIGPCKEHKKRKA